MEPLIVQQPPEAERHEEGEEQVLATVGDAEGREAAQEREHLARQRSFAERYSEMFPRMLLYARKHVPPDDAYDIVQDVLAGMWKNWDLIPPGARDGPQLYLSAVRKRLSTFRR
ncbi:MAG TPA: hypothetical protein VJ867_00245, partial [Gemmatimonadaceae bacterium]|nr:hypothetical protein [Gemmatimonadaceae bacterium]